MTCDQVREFLLSLDLDEAGRRQAVSALSHLEACPRCKLAMQDFDDIAAPLVSADSVGASHEESDTGPADESAGDETMAQPVLRQDSSNGPRGGWGAFEQRMLAVLQGGRRRISEQSPRMAPICSSPPRATASRSIVSKRIIPPLCKLWIGSAVALAICAVGISLRIRLAAPTQPAAVTLQTSAIVRPSSDAPAELVAVAEVRKQVKAFQKFNGMTQGKTRWIMLTQGDSDAGTLPRGAATPKMVDHVLFVRLSLLGGAGLQSCADLVLVPGEDASVSVPLGDGMASALYRVASSAADPLQLSVRLELPADAEAGESPAVATTMRLKPYVSVSVGRILTRQGTYDLKIAAAAATLPPEHPQSRPLSS